MSTDFQELTAALSAATLQGAGQTAPELREAVANYTAALGKGQSPDNSGLARELIMYLFKIAVHPYKIVDADINRLKAQQYSEDEIFELTLSAALGAGLARLECGLDSLANA